MTMWKIIMYNIHGKNCKLVDNYYITCYTCNSFVTFVNFLQQRNKVFLNRKYLVLYKK